MYKHIQNIRLAISQNQDKVDSINAFQGAVTEDGFKVYSKLSKSNVSATLQVFTDAEMTNLVFTSTPTISDEFNVVRFQVSGLTPFTKYYWSIIYKGRKTTITGEIKTLPSGNASFKIVAGSCAVGPQIPGPDFRYSNHEIFRHIKEDRADEIALMWHTGDIHYQDIKSENAIDYSNAFDGVLRQYKQQELYLKVPLMYMWDDHDFTGNDSNGAKNPEWTAPALESYRKRIPSYDLPFSGALEPVCHQVKIGRVLLINLDCRSQKEKHLGTILGTIQKQWLKDTMIASDAEAFIINVGVPWISPSGGDMWGSVALERTELMDFWADNGLSSKIILLAGDAHCVAIDDGTNNQDKDGTGIPVFQFAAYDSPPTVKGGPYSEGYSDNMYQYGMIDIEDKGTSIEITGSGHRVVGGSSIPLPQSYTHIINVSVPTYEAETIAYMTAIGIPNDSATYYSTLKNSDVWDIIDDYVKSEKANGSFEMFDYPMIGSTATQHSYNLVDTSKYQITWFGGWIHSELGAKANGTNTYGKTGFIPSVEQDVYSNGLSYVSGTDLAETNSIVIPIGAVLAGNNGSLIAANKSASPSIRTRMNLDNINGSTSTNSGVATAVRQSNTVTKLFKNGSLLGSGNSGGILSMYEVFLGTSGYNGNPQSYYSLQRFQGFKVHIGLTDTQVSQHHANIDAREAALLRKTW